MSYFKVLNKAIFIIKNQVQRCFPSVVIMLLNCKISNQKVCPNDIKKVLLGMSDLRFVGGEII